MKIWYAFYMQIVNILSTMQYWKKHYLKDCINYRMIWVRNKKACYKAYRELLMSQISFMVVENSEICDRHSVHVPKLLYIWI